MRPSTALAGFIAAFSLVFAGLDSNVAALTDPNVPGIFYPFGTDVGDEVAPVEDDGSTDSIPIAGSFPFFGSSDSILYVNSNGDISFGTPVWSYTPISFPVADRVIAPFWSDVDTSMNDGRIYYRAITVGSLLDRATQDILAPFAQSVSASFRARWIFIATWYNVTFYGGSDSTPLNTFQAVLITNGLSSFVMFNYGAMTWTTGTASGGDYNTGLGGTAAQVGFNAGDNVHYLALPGSQTQDILNIPKGSNVNIVGRWVFQVDSGDIVVPFTDHNKYTQSAGGVYDCDARDPCTSDNRALHIYYFPHRDQTKFIQCSDFGQCYVMPCGPGQVWNDAVKTCTAPHPVSGEVVTHQPGSSAYNCLDRNPCTVDSYSSGHAYFPNDLPSKYVQCDAWGQCFVMPCPSGLVWDANINQCNNAATKKRRRRHLKKD